MKAFAIAGVNLRRLFRQRSSIFFVIILPMMLILWLGPAFGGSYTPMIGIVGQGIGPLGEEIVTFLEEADSLDVKLYADEADLMNAVERGRVQAGLVIPSGYDDTLRSGGEVTVSFFGRPGSLAQQLGAIVRAAVSEQNALVRAARFAESEGVASSADSMTLAAETAAVVPGVQVRTTTAGETLFGEDTGKFDQGASSQLLLFIFITSLTGSAALIETRRLGLSRRMLATPTPTGVILTGEALGRFSIALLQGLIIILGSALVFGVNWGDPLGAALIVVLFCLVGAGAGMLLGSVFNTDQQASSMAMLFGLGLAALGGSMAPLEIFPDVMRTIAHFTPHAWGNDAFAELVRHGGGVAEILTELGALAAFAVVLLSLATWRLRKAITS